MLEARHKYSQLYHDQYLGDTPFDDYYKGTLGFKFNCKLAREGIASVINV